MNTPRTLCSKLRVMSRRNSIESLPTTPKSKHEPREQHPDERADDCAERDLIWRPWRSLRHPAFVSAFEALVARVTGLQLRASQLTTNAAMRAHGIEDALAV